MEGWTAIAIGVRKAGSLPELPGAVNGAKNFAAWAKDRGYEVHLVTDEKKNEAVRSERLRTLLKTIVDEGATTRLLVYFSGHGAQPASAPFWLLSDWETDSNEAVNEGISRLNADRSGIQQIAFFVDACRVSVPGAQLINGFCLFPTRPPHPHPPRWDLFYGARVDAISQEIPETDAVAAYGIFSNCLMDALSGRAESAIQARPGLKPEWGVTSDSLANYLEDEMPRRSGRMTRVQPPDVRPGWWRPDNVYLEVGAQPHHYALKVRPSRTAERDHGDLKVSILETCIGRALGRPSFETRMGVSLIGAQPLRVTLAAGDPPVDLFEEDGAWHLRGHQGESQSVLVEVEGGGWLGATLFAGFVGTVLFERGAAASLIYTPARYGPRENEVPSSVVERAIYWTALMRTGGSLPSEDLEEALASLPAYPHVNPTLAILLAYACFDAGRLRDVTHIEDAMAAAGQPIPFDVSLLAQASRGGAAVAGRFPLLSRGWALLEAAADSPNARALAEVRPGIVPSLWTTLSAERGSLLSSLMESGAL